MLKEGTNAPAFKTTDQNGETVSLKDLRGQKVVLYFYPQRRHARMHQGGVLVSRRLFEVQETRHNGAGSFTRQRGIAQEVCDQI